MRGKFRVELVMARVVVQQFVVEDSTHQVRKNERHSDTGGSPLAWIMTGCEPLFTLRRDY
jgi:hypothetical protein